MRAALLVLLVLLTCSPGHAEQTISPQQDLAQATHRAADGAVLQLESGRFKGPIVVEGKGLTIKGQADGSSVVATDAADAVVMILAGGRAKLENITIEAGRSGQLGVYVHEGELEMSGGSVGKSADDAIYVEAGTLSLHGTRVADSADAGIIAQRGATILLDRAVVEQVKGTALHFQDGATLEVKDSRLVGRTALVVHGGSPAVTILDSRLTGQNEDSSAVALQQGGTIAVRGNVVSGGGDGLYLAPAATAATIEIVENLIYGSKRGGIALQAREALNARPSLRANRLLIDGAAQNAYGIFLNGRVAADLSDNRIVVRKGIGLALREGATASLTGDVVFGEDFAISLDDAEQETSTLAGALPIPTDGIEGIPQVDDRSRAMMVAIDDELESKLRQARDDALGLAAAGAAEPSVTVDRYFDELEAELASLQSAAASLGSVTLRVRDAAGKEDFASFALLDDAGEELSHHDASNPVAPVPAGNYLIAPDFDPLQILEVAVEPGTPTTLQLDQPNALWLSASYNAKRPPARALITLRPQAERAEIARNIRMSNDAHYLAERRSSATAEEIAAALALARAWLYSDAEKHQPKDDSDDATWGRYWAMSEIAYRILAIAGDASDERALIDKARKHRYLGPTSGEGIALAQIAARLGTLENGELVALVESKETDLAIGAAIILHRHGLRRFDAFLRDSMLNPADPKHLGRYLYAFAHAMLDDGSPEALATMRALWQRHNARAAELAAMTDEQRQGQNNPYVALSEPAPLYFLAYGTPEDWSSLRLENIDYFAASAIAAFAADPSQSAGLLAQQGYYPALVGMVPHLTALREADVASAVKAVGDQVYNLAYDYAIEQNAWRPDDEARATLNEFLARTSGHWPNEKMPNFFFFGPEKLGKIDPMNWAPFAWRFAEAVERVVRGDRNDSFAAQIDFIPHDQFVQLMTEKNAAASLPSADLVLAYHRVATRASWVTDASKMGFLTADGHEWQRPFLMQIKSTADRYGGAISGRLDLRPAFVNDELRLRIDVPHFGFYEEYCTLAAKIATDCNQAEWLHHEHVLDASKLIAGVRLKRGEVELPLRKLPVEGPDHVLYAADLPDRNLAGLRVEIDLALGEDRRGYAFHLYGRGFAKAERLAASHIAEARAATDAQPDSAEAQRALAEAQRASGRFDAGWESYRRALSLNPSDTRLWYDAAAMFQDAGFAERALAVYAEGVAARPQDLDLRYSLGVAAYDSGKFAEAADAFGGVVAAAPDDHEARLWQGHSLFLARDWAGAGAAYDALPAERRTHQVALLSAIAAAEAHGGAVPDLAAFDAMIERLKPAESDEWGAEAALDPCHADFYGGYRHLYGGESDKAKAAFERARTSCAAGTIEQRALSAIMQ